MPSSRIADLIMRNSFSTILTFGLDHSGYGVCVGEGPYSIGKRIKDLLLSNTYLVFLLNKIALIDFFGVLAVEGVTLTLFLQHSDDEAFLINVGFLGKIGFTGVGEFGCS